MVTSFNFLYSVAHRPTIIVKLTDDMGTEGYGEGAALPLPMCKQETTDTSFLAIKDYISPHILGKEFTDVAKFVALLQPIKGYRIAKSALENAVWMILSLREGKSITELLGGTSTYIPVGESIGFKPTIKETLEESALRLEQGYQRIKLKIRPSWDIAVVRAVRRAFGNIELSVDANSVYTLRDIDTLKELDHYGLTMIEQPLGSNDIVDHAVLQKSLKTPLCLDESIESADDARKAISIGACRIINIKVGHVGGLLEAKKIHDLCRVENIGVLCGGMLETGIGKAFNLAAASLPNYVYPADMSPPLMYYEADLVKSGFSVTKDGLIRVPDVPGLGFDIDHKSLRKYTVECITLT